jgi:phage terminase Nu1 subunit (DNA packaging protein)
MGNKKNAASTLLTRRELARRLNVHMMTISAKWEPAGMPIAERGRGGRPSLYNEQAVRAWLQEREEAAKSGKLRDVQQARAKKEIAQAALAEQTYQIRDGAYILRAEAERAWAGEVNAAKQHALAWATTLADKLYRAATLEGLAGVERILNSAVRELLREFKAGEHRRGEDEPPAAAAVPAMR